MGRVGDILSTQVGKKGFERICPKGAVLDGEIGDMIPRNTAGNAIPQRYRLGISADLFREETV